MNFKFYDSEVKIDTTQSMSQAGQDLFVIAMTQGKQNGTFFEIGAGHPKFFNNTYYLEKNLKWSGISVDLQDHFPKHDSFNWVLERPNTNFIKSDIFKFDFKLVPKFIDYLQIDLDHPLNCLKALKLAVQNTEYSVITFEHDIFVKNNSSYKAKHTAKKLLETLGYELVVNNVTIEPSKGESVANEHMMFEDWYVNPKYIDRTVINHYKWVDLEYKPKYYYDILFR